MADEESAGNSGGLNAPAISLLNDLHSLRTRVRLKHQGSSEAIGIFQEEQHKFQEILPKLDELETGLTGNDKAKEDFQVFVKAVRDRSSTVSEEISKLEAAVEEGQRDEDKVVAYIESVQKLLDEEQEAAQVEAKLSDLKEEASGVMIEITGKIDEEPAAMSVLSKTDSVDVEKAFDAWETTSEVVRSLRQELADTVEKSDSEIADLKKKLEESETLANTINEKLRELQKEVDDLSSAKEELEKKNEKLEKEKRDLAEEKSDVESNNDKLESKVREITSAKSDLEFNVEDLERKLEKSKREVSSLEKQNDGLKDQVNELNDQNDDLNSKIRKLTSTKEDFEASNERLEHRIQEISSARSELESDIDELRRKLEDSKRDASSLERQNDGLKERVNELEEQNEDLNSKVKKLSITKEELESSNERLEHRVRETSSDKSQLESDVHDLKRKLEDSKRDASSLDEQNDELKDKMRELNEQNEQLESKVRKLNSLKNELESDNESLGSKLRETKSANSELESNVDELKHKLERSDREVASLSKDKEELRDQVKELTVVRERLESKSEDLKVEVRGLVLSKQDLELECDELKRKLGRLENTAAELEKTEHRLRAQQKENNEMQDELVGLKTKLSKADKLQRRIANIAVKLEDGVESGDEEDGETSTELEGIRRLVSSLKSQLEDNRREKQLLEKYASEEKDKSDKNTDEMERLLAKIESNQNEKEEQAKLVDTIKGLLDENEKLAANLEEQNKALSEEVLEERQRVAELRSRVGELQRLIDDEKTNKQESGKDWENMKERLEDEKARHENSLRRIEVLKQQLEDLEAARAARDEKMSELERTATGSSEKLQAERRRNEANEQSLMELQNQMVMKDKLLERRESVVKDSEKKVEGLEKQLEWLVENNKVLTLGLQENQRQLEDSNTNKESERSLKDEYAIRCDMLMKKLELTESECSEMSKCVEIAGKNLEEEREKVDLCEKEIELLAEELQGEKNKNTDNQVLIQDLQEQLGYFEALNEYNNGIKSSSIENIMEAEQENERLQDHISELVEKLNKKDSAIEELMTTYAMEEQVYKQECEKDKLLVEQLRAEIQELRLREIDCDRIREKEGELCQVQHKLQNEREKGKYLQGQVARLEHLTRLEEEAESERYSEMTHDRVNAMKAEYQKKKVEQKDEEIRRLANEVDELYEKLKVEQRQVGDRDIIIFELNAANNRDQRTIEKLSSELLVTRQQAEAEKSNVEEMTGRLEEGRKLIAELETVAERERSRAVAMEDVLSSEKGKYNQQMGVVKDLKKKVEEYQKTVTEVRNKVDKLNRHIHCGTSHVDGPRPVGDASVRKLNEKLSEHKTIIKELKANLNAVEERNESLSGQLQEQRGKNQEQDTKLKELLGKSSNSEHVITDIKTQLEEVKARYQGLSLELHTEDDECDSSREDVTSPTPQSPTTLARYVRSIPEQALSKQLARFENLFENIFCEEAKRMEELQNNLQGVMNKNTEFAELLLQIKGSLDEEKKKGSTHRTELEELESKLRRSEVQIDNLITAVEKEGGISRELYEEIRALRQQKDEKEDSIRDLKDELRVAKDIERKLRELKDELKSRDAQLEELQVDLDTERKCYKIVSERLQSEQSKNCELESKVSEFEHLTSSDKETFEHLRLQMDSENSKNRKLLEEIDNERGHALELEEKVKELEEQILHDMDLFEELRATIEREKEQSRNLDSMLQDEKRKTFSKLDLGDATALDLEQRLLYEMKRSGELQAAVRQQQEQNYELDTLNAQLMKVVRENEDAMTGSNKGLEEEKKKNDELCERVWELQGKVLNCREQIQALLTEGERDFHTKHETQKRNEELTVQLAELQKSFDAINDSKQSEVSAKLDEAVSEAQKRLKRATAILAAKENALQKSKQKYDRMLLEREAELGKRERAFIALRKALEGLRLEKEREEASKKARALKLPGGERQKFDDVDEIIKDLKLRIEKLEGEVESKDELAQIMREDLAELRNSKDGDPKLLARKENLHRVVRSEIEEAEKKMKRLQKLRDLLEEIMREGVVSHEESAQLANAPECLPTQAPSSPRSGRLPTVIEEECAEVVAPPVVEEQPLQVCVADFAGAPVVWDSADLLECYDGGLGDQKLVGELGFQEFDKELFKYAKSLQDEGPGDDNASRQTERDAADRTGEDFADGAGGGGPPRESVGQEDFGADSKRPTALNWRVVVGGIALTLLMLAMQRYLPPKVFGVVSALLFLPATILVSRYERKKMQKEMQKRAALVSGDNGDLRRRLVEEQEKLEELRLLTEGDARVIQELRTQLEEEIAEKDGAKEELELAKADKEFLRGQGIVIESMSGRMRQLEKASIDGAEKQTQGFEEYKKLRERVDKLARDRAEEMKKDEARLLALPCKEETKFGWKAVKKLNLPIASVPLCVGAAIVLYHLSSLHALAPYVIFCSLTLISGNAWYTVKRWSRVLDEERRIGAETKEELEEVVELLDREYDVVKAQKSAIDMLVKEIEDEQASRKAKQVALAKLIWQLQEMEGMQTLLLKERRHESGVKDWQSSLRQVAQEKAEEKAKTYSSIISQLKQIGAADTAEEDEMTEDLCEAAKELTKYAEEQIDEVNKLLEENAKPGPARAKKLPLSWKTVAIVTLNTVMLGAALIFRSYYAAAVLAVQAVLYALQRKRSAARLGSVTDDVTQLKEKVALEIQRNKIQQAENEKLKKLLRTAGRYKRSDEFATEVKERCKKRAQQRQP